MIITKEKPLEEILDFISPHRRILVVGCDGCTQPPRGLKEAQTMAKLIEMNGKLNKKEIECRATTVVKQCCNTSVANLRTEMEGCDAMLSMACGVGVQVLNEVFPEIPTYPAQDTMFIGSEEIRQGPMYERCQACGECILDETGGICPVTRCAKGLLNGPCGGCVDGKCELPVKVGDKTVQNDCAWYLIYHRLKELGKLDLFKKYRPPKDRSLALHPRRL
ncbi:MAG: methylenetetrahydrofolate reductase C-terminal domain-containing protein [Candidatus Syntropharchaeia archaeon]